MRMSPKRLAVSSVLCAFAIILGYVESLIPINIGIPGFKIGLPNLVIVFALYCLTPLDAALINLIRIIITGLLFGSLFSIMFSIAGAVLSFLCMWPLSRIKKFSVAGVSIAGGVTHNIAQLLVAVIILGVKEILYYMPLLLIAGLITGLIIGLISGILIKNLNKTNIFNNDIR